MRHGKKFNHLKRKSAHRKAMLANMASSLIMHKRIKTTTAKAKALRTYIEPLITKAKTDNTHSRRVVFSYLKNKNAVSELFREVAERISDRPGGYTRILKTSNRLGDNAEMCFIELVDYNENYRAPGQSKEKASGSRRSRRGGRKKKTQQETTQETKSEEAPVKTEEAKTPESEEQKKETPKTDDKESGEVKSPESKKSEKKEESTEEKKAEGKKAEKKEEPAKKAEEQKKDQPDARKDNKSTGNKETGKKSEKKDQGKENKEE